MQTDTLRLAFTYIIAIIVIIGGGILLVIPSQVPPEQLLPFMTGIFGAVVAYVFSRETQTGTSRMVERVTAAAAAAQPTVTATSGPPATTTITPAPTPTGDQP